MVTIRMVSDAEGKQLQRDEEARQKKIKALLVGATVTGVKFSGSGITDHDIKALWLEKNGVKYKVDIEADQFYTSIISRLVITDTDTLQEVK